MLSPDRPEYLSEATIPYGLYGKKEKKRNVLRLYSAVTGTCAGRQVQF